MRECFGVRVKMVGAFFIELFPPTFGKRLVYE